MRIAFQHFNHSIIWYYHKCPSSCRIHAQPHWKQCHADDLLGALTVPAQYRWTNCT